MVAKKGGQQKKSEKGKPSEVDELKAKIEMLVSATKPITDRNWAQVLKSTCPEWNKILGEVNELRDAVEMTSE